MAAACARKTEGPNMREKPKEESFLSKVLNPSNKSKSVDPQVLTEKLSHQKIISQVAEMIESNTLQNDKENKIFQILVRKIKHYLNNSGKCDGDDVVCEMTAVKLANFVQDIMHETIKCEVNKINEIVGLQRMSTILEEEENHSKIAIERSSERMIAVHEPAASQHTILVEEVNAGSVARKKHLDGRRLQLQTVTGGNEEKAIIRLGKLSESGKKDFDKLWTKWKEQVSKETHKLPRYLEGKAESKEVSLSKTGRSGKGKREDDKGWRRRAEEMRRRRREGPGVERSSSGDSLDKSSLERSSSTESVWSMRELVGSSQGSSPCASRQPGPLPHSCSNYFRRPPIPPIYCTRQ